MRKKMMLWCLLHEFCVVHKLNLVVRHFRSSMVQHATSQHRFYQCYGVVLLGLRPIHHLVLGFMVQLMANIYVGISTIYTGSFVFA